MECIENKNKMNTLVQKQPKLDKAGTRSSVSKEHMRLYTEYSIYS